MVRNHPEKRSLIATNNAGKERPSRWIFRGVNISVTEGQCVGLLGPNGCGKSTLLRSLLGFERLSEGSVMLEGEPLPQSAVALTEIRKRIGFVAQGLHLWPYRTILDNVSEAPRFGLGLSKKESRTIAREWLKRLNLTAHENKYPQELSGGEQQRVAIARALALNPRAIILDEPTSGLDPIASGEISELLTELHREGITLLIVSHQIDLLRRIADFAYFLEGGLIRESGDAREILTDPQTPELRRFIEKVRLGW